MDCQYCYREIETIDCLYPNIHGKCADEWDRREDARLCVMCGESLPDDVPTSGPGAHKHQSCRENGTWSGYDIL